MDQHYLKSSFREKLIEHLFIGELLKLSWIQGNCSVEISRPEVDNQGYDIIVEDNGIIRYIQLKTAHIESTVARQQVHIALSAKPSGCIVWVYFNEKTMKLGPFLFFGNSHGQPLPSIDGFRVARHTKANAQGVKTERPEIREIPKSKFTKYATIKQIYKQLFSS